MTDKQYADKLDTQIIEYGKENQFIEFKSNYQDAFRLGKYISALSNGATLNNEEYGYLYFGVDDSTLTIKGTTFDASHTMVSNKENTKSKQPLELYLRQYITPKINFTIREIIANNNQRVVVFEIPAAKGEPTNFLNIPYIRVDSSVTELRPYTEWMRQIYNSTVDWSREIIDDASVNDLHPEAIKVARQGYKERNPDLADEVDNWSDTTFLDRARITIGGRITRTALLLLGKAESSYKLNHIAQIVWKLQTSTESAGEIFTIPFILATTNLRSKIRNYQFKIYPDNVLIPAEVWKYDNRNILEGLHNCIAHQDYFRNERIIVTERENDLTFENGGSFYEGAYEDYIEGRITPKKYRNPFLANAMVNIKMIDTRGLGIHWMFQRQRKSYLPMPEYDKSLTDSVKLTMQGYVIDIDYSLMLMNASNLDLITVYLLDKVQKKRPIPDDAAIFLRKQKLIEGRKPNYHISRQVAKITHSEAHYTKLKGLDDNYYKSLIISALKQHGPQKIAFFKDLLFDKLPDILTPDQRKSKVKNLLTALRKSGKIKSTKGNLWVLSD
ncbi:MAG: transcriptional regulator [Bacteroidales bacterium]|nr:transcriptional regulator [Bacteroidales bacterium]